MKTILVPVDFSPVTRSVVTAAVRLARLVRGNLCLMSVVQPPPIIASEYGVVAEDIGPYLEAAEKGTKQRLTRLQQGLRSPLMSVTTLQMTGVPVACILDAARKKAAEYIVIGSHGHTAFYDLVVGSTARGVLKRAACPVLVVPAPRKTKALSKRKR